MPAKHASGPLHFAGKVTSNSPEIGEILCHKHWQFIRFFLLTWKYSRDGCLIIWFAVTLTNQRGNRDCHKRRYAGAIFCAKFTSLTAPRLFVGPGDHSRLGASLHYIKFCILRKSFTNYFLHTAFFIDEINAVRQKAQHYRRYIVDEYHR